MAKALKTAALIVGVVALTLSVPGLGPAIGAQLGLSAATTAAVAAGLGVAATVLGLAATALMPRGSMAGSCVAFRLSDPIPPPG